MEKQAKSKLKHYSKSYSKLFPFTLTILCVGDDLNETYNEALNKGFELWGKNREDLNKFEAFVFNDDTTEVFLILTPNITLDILVHELIHITSAVFRIIGSDINEETEEFFAYITQALFRDIIKILKNKFKIEINF